MASLAQKIHTEHRMRELLEQEGLPPPAAIEYGHTCVRFFWHEPKTCIVVDIDPPADGRLETLDGEFEFDEDVPGESGQSAA